VVAGVGGPADLFCFYLLRDCWRSAIIQSLDQPVRYNLERIEMKNEYVIYWRQEVLYRSKVLASSEEEAKSLFLRAKKNNVFKDDIDEEDEDSCRFSIDSLECIEEDVDYD
jgi:hypothetical protein